MNYEEIKVRGRLYDPAQEDDFVPEEYDEDDLESAWWDDSDEWNENMELESDEYPLDESDEDSNTLPTSSDLDDLGW